MPVPVLVMLLLFRLMLAGKKGPVGFDDSVVVVVVVVFLPRKLAFRSRLVVASGRLGGRLGL